MASPTSRGTTDSLAGCRSWLQGQHRGKQGGTCTVPAEQGRVCAHQPGFLTPCSAWLWRRNVYFPRSLSGGSRRWASPRCQESLVAASCGLVSGRVDLAGCWAQKSTAHNLLVAELLEDAHEDLCLHSHERDGKTLLGCSACRDAVKAL